MFCYQNSSNTLLFYNTHVNENNWICNISFAILEWKSAENIFPAEWKRKQTTFQLFVSSTKFLLWKCVPFQVSISSKTYLNLYYCPILCECIFHCWWKIQKMVKHCFLKKPRNHYDRPHTRGVTHTLVISRLSRGVWVYNKSSASFNANSKRGVPDYKSL